MTPKSLIEPARHAGTALLRSQSDARLVDLTRDGNERAFEAIVHRYRRPLLRYCSRLLPLTRAEDAVQQAFLSAHRAIHAGEQELNLKPWLYRIAHNASLNLLRQHGFDHDQVSEEIDGVETPPQAFERGERLRTVVAAVQDLPERQRSAILLQAVEGRSYDEIAAELGVTDGAVRQLLNRARNTLREAAAALTPAGLITRAAAGGGEAGIAERITAAVVGGGGGALLAKGGAALIVAGAVAGGAATGALPGTGGHHDARGGVRDSVRIAPAVAALPGSSATGTPQDVVLTGNRRPARAGEPHSSRGHRSSSGSGSHEHGGGSSGERGGSGRDGSGSGSDGGSRSHDNSGSGSSGSGGSSDGRSGSSSDDGSSRHSGSSTSGSSGSSGDDSSGSSGGSDGRSGSGSGDGGSSGSGSSTSGGGSDGTYSVQAPLGDDSSGSGTSSSGSSGGSSDDGTTTDSSSHKDGGGS